MLPPNSQNNIGRSAADVSLRYSDYDPVASKGEFRTIDNVFGPQVTYSPADNLIYYIGYDQWPSGVGETEYTETPDQVVNIDLEDSSFYETTVLKRGSVQIDPSEAHDSKFKGSLKFNGDGDHLIVTIPELGCDADADGAAPPKPLGGSTCPQNAPIYRERYKYSGEEAAKKNSLYMLSNLAANDGEFTIEFWVKPEKLDEEYNYQTIIDVQSKDVEGPEGPNEHASFLHIAIGSGVGGWDKGKVYVKSAPMLATGVKDFGETNKMEDPRPSDKKTYAIPSENKLNLTSTTLLSEGTWYHIAVVKKEQTGNDQVDLYINGTSEANQTWTNTVAAGALTEYYGVTSTKFNYFPSGAGLENSNQGNPDPNNPHPWNGYVENMALGVSPPWYIGVQAQFSEEDVWMTSTPWGKSKRGISPEREDAVIMRGNQQADVSGGSLREVNFYGYFRGWLNEMRVSEKAMYTANFSTPSNPFEPDDSLLEAEGGEGEGSESAALKLLIKGSSSAQYGDSIPAKDSTGTHTITAVNSTQVGPAEWFKPPGNGIVIGYLVGADLGHYAGYLSVAHHDDFEMKDKTTKVEFWMHNNSIDLYNSDPNTYAGHIWKHSSSTECWKNNTPLVSKFKWNPQLNSTDQTSIPYEIEGWAIYLDEYGHVVLEFGIGDGNQQPIGGTRPYSAFDTPWLNRYISTNRWSDPFPRGGDIVDYASVDYKYMFGAKSGRCQHTMYYLTTGGNKATNTIDWTGQFGEGKEAWAIDEGPRTWIREHDIGSSGSGFIINNHAGTEWGLPYSTGLNWPSGAWDCYGGYAPYGTTHSTPSGHGYIYKGILGVNNLYHERGTHDKWKMPRGEIYTIKSKFPLVGGANNISLVYESGQVKRKTVHDDYKVMPPGTPSDGAKWDADAVTGELFLYINGVVQGSIRFEELDSWASNAFNNNDSDLVIGGSPCQSASGACCKTQALYVNEIKWTSWDKSAAPRFQNQWDWGDSTSPIPQLNNEFEDGYNPPRESHVFQNNEKYRRCDAATFPDNDNQPFPWQDLSILPWYDDIWKGGENLDPATESPEYQLSNLDYEHESKRGLPPYGNLQRYSYLTGGGNLFVNPEQKSYGYKKMHLCFHHYDEDTGIVHGFPNLRFACEYANNTSTCAPQKWHVENVGMESYPNVDSSYTPIYLGTLACPQSLFDEGRQQERGFGGNRINGCIRFWTIGVGDGAVFAPSDLQVGTQIYTINGGAGWDLVQPGFDIGDSNTGHLSHTGKADYASLRGKTPDDIGQIRDGRPSGEPDEPESEWFVDLDTKRIYGFKNIDGELKVDRVYQCPCNLSDPTSTEETLSPTVTTASPAKTSLLLHFDAETQLGGITATIKNSNYGLCTFNPFTLQSKRIKAFDDPQYKAYLKDGDSNYRYRQTTIPKNIIYSPYDNSLHMVFMQQLRKYIRTEGEDVSGGEYTGGRGTANHRYETELYYRLYKFDINARTLSINDEAGDTAKGVLWHALWKDDEITTGKYSDEGFRWLWKQPDWMHAMYTSIGVNPRSGEVLTLHSRSGNHIGYRKYGDSLPWPTQPPGSVWGGDLPGPPINLYGDPEGNKRNPEITITAASNKFSGRHGLASSEIYYKGYCPQGNCVGDLTNPSESAFTEPGDDSPGLPISLVFRDFYNRLGPWMPSLEQHGILPMVPISNDDYESNNILWIGRNPPINYNLVEHQNNWEEVGAWNPKIVFCSITGTYHNQINERGPYYDFIYDSSLGKRFAGGYILTEDFGTGTGDSSIQDTIEVPSQGKMLYLVRYSQDGVERTRLIYMTPCVPNTPRRTPGGSDLYDPPSGGDEYDHEDLISIHPCDSTGSSSTATPLYGAVQEEISVTSPESIIYCPSNDRIYLLARNTLLKIIPQTLQVEQRYQAPTGGARMPSVTGVKVLRSFIPIYSHANDTIYYLSNDINAKSFLFEPNH